MVSGTSEAQGRALEMCLSEQGTSDLIGIPGSHVRRKIAAATSQSTGDGRPFAVVPAKISGCGLIALPSGMHIGGDMPIDRVRRKLVNGFACTAVCAAMLPCCLGRAALAAAGDLAFKIRKVATTSSLPGRG
ncbi:hypothetical protein NKJ40_01780 [Mesorhizobium sp. M0119]|uniref:hypothetical protein n=1 Tax=Mesorhizobium sp. M0119 TaxID=2956885 RepID=UPI003335264B